jgi:hypothetical protein
MPIEQPTISLALLVQLGRVPGCPGASPAASLSSSLIGSIRGTPHPGSDRSDTGNARRPFLVGDIGAPDAPIVAAGGGMEF